MMKMNKKAVAVVTVLMMLALCLTGCGSSNADQGSDNDGQQSSAATTNLVFASGGTSGTYYPVAGAIAQVWETMWMALA